MNQRRRWTGLLLAGAGVLALTAATPCLAEQAAPPKKIVTIEGITQYDLDNGLKILLYPDDSTPTVTVNVTVLVGSRLEGYGEAGMAHLLEHMQFKGTPNHPNIPKVLKEHGANFNATTWVDRTNYFETLPATEANLDFALNLEADRLVNSYVRGSDLRSEMTVVRNEFEMGENDPERILDQRILACAYEWHNYGKSTIGNRSDIERVPISHLQTFYHKYYRPDNAILIIAGRFNPGQALAAAVKYFGALPRPAVPLEESYTQEPPQDGERSVHLRRVGKVGLVGVVYHIPAAAEADYPPLRVLNGVLVDEPSGRLYKALVASHKATSVSGEAYALHDPGVLDITAQVDPKGLAEARDAMLDLLENLGGQQFTPEEVERAKLHLLKERELLMTQPGRVAMQLGEWQARGDWRLFFLERDRIEKVTPADLARVAGKYLMRSNRTAGEFLPTEQPRRAEVPETPAVAALLKDYHGHAEVAPGESFDPTPQNIEKRTRRAQVRIGLKMAFLPKKTRGETVAAELTLRFGNDKSLAGHVSATQFLGPLLARGTRKHSRQEIQDRLDQLGARLTPRSSLGEISFTIQAKRKTLPDVLALLGEILREPTFPQAEFDILKREARDSLEKNSTEPMPLALRSLQRKLSPYPPEDVRYVPTTEEELSRLDAVTLAEVQQLYTDQVGAQAGELAVVGDFDPDATARQMGDLLNHWEAKTPFRRIEQPAQTGVAGVRQVIQTPDKANAFYVAGELLALTDTDPDYPALEVANFLFGGGTLSSRLGNRVRQQEGLSYGVRSVFSADAKDKSAHFTMAAICNPVNIDKVDQAILEELDRLLKDGAGAGEVAEAKKGYLEQAKVQRANDGHLASLLVEDLFNDRTFAYYADLEKKVAALTPEETVAAFRKHVAPGRLVIVEAGDFHKKVSSRK